MISIRSIIITIILLSCGSLSWAQVTVGSTPELDSLRAEIRELRLSLDSLRSVQQEHVSSTDSEVLGLEELIDRKLKALEAKLDAAVRSTANVVFNPAITGFLNVAGRADNHLVQASSGEGDVDNKLFLRGVELDFRAPVDPYADAVVIVALEDEAGTGYHTDVEEAYAVIKRLPILESAPLGLKWKVGRYRIPFGQNNMLHQHDLPWTNRPLPVVLFLGTEHGPFFESGTNPIGMDFAFFIPSPIPGITIEANADILRGGDLGLAQEHSGGKFAGLGHVGFSSDLSNEHLISFGASAYEERGASPTSLYGVDLLYKWAPAERRSERSLVAGAELFFGDHTFADSLDIRQQVKPGGGFAYVQYQASNRWYVGARYDWAGEPTDPNLRTRVMAGYISYYTTEFLRLRFGVEHSLSDIVERDKLTTALFELNVVFGSHPTEPYWVNR